MRFALTSALVLALTVFASAAPIADVQDLEARRCLIIPCVERSLSFFSSSFFSLALGRLFILPSFVSSANAPRDSRAPSRAGQFPLPLLWLWRRVVFVPPPSADAHHLLNFPSYSWGVLDC